jgi:peptide/nickel transport system substrate-binding protein
MDKKMMTILAVAVAAIVVVSAAVVITNPVKTAPSAVLNLQATRGDSSATLTWSPPSSNGTNAVDGYRLYRGTSSGSLNVMIEMGMVSSYKDTGLTNGLTYFFQVTALSSAGESPKGSVVQTTPSPNPPTAPSAPGNLVVQSGRGYADVTWNAPADNGGAAITSYKVMYGNASGIYAKTNVVGNALSCRLSGLANATYYIVVKAVNQVGDGAASAERSAPVLSEIAELVVGTTMAIDNLNIMDYNMGILRGELTHQSFIKLDANGSFIPCLVTSWSSSDAKVWNMTVRSDVLWHDGVPLTAEDLKFTVDYLKVKDPQMASHWQMIQDVTVVSPTKITITLDKPYYNFLVEVLVGRVLPKHIYESVSDPATFSGAQALIGTGPYKFDSFDKSAGKISFTAFAGYYEGKPSVDKITLRIFKNSDAMVMALEKGEIDTVHIYSKGVSYYYVPALLKAGVNILTTPNLGVPNVLWFNEAKAPYDNLTFRQAISCCLNYNEIMNIMTAGYGSVPNAGFVPEGTYGYKDTAMLAQNVTKANLLLDQAGFLDINGDGWREAPNGTAFAPSLLTRADSPDYARVCELIKGYMNAVKINVQVKVMDKNTVGNILDLLKTHEMAVTGTTYWGMNMWVAWGAGYIDGRNMGWSMTADPVFQDIVDRLFAAQNDTQAVQLAGELQDYYASQQPIIPLYWGDIIQPTSAKFSGWGMDPMYGIMSYQTFFDLRRA